MKLYLVKICLFLFCFCWATLLSGQNTAEITTKSSFTLSPFKKELRIEAPPPSYRLQNPESILFMPFDPQCLPFFCKIEHQLFKKSKVNVKFRLGSVDYVDKLEGK